MPTVKAPTLDHEAGSSPAPAHGETLERRLEQHRTELTAFCRRMVGSCDAEDAVQETLLRAWRGFDRFEGRAALRSWLYRIAFNVCLDSLRARQRHARRIEMLAGELSHGPAAGAQPTALAGAPAGAVHAALDIPAETAVAREAVRLALTTLMRLPPRQRAVLILRDVLRWKATEVAQFLDMTVASVNSVRQRARSTLARGPSPSSPPSPEAVAQREVIARFVDAFERYDLEGLSSIVREDAGRSLGGARPSSCRVHCRVS
jgi:RNA polymerase sigma-70 factor (ECF subfamily)